MHLIWLVSRIGIQAAAARVRRVNGLVCVSWLVLQVLHFLFYFPKKIVLYMRNAANPYSCFLAATNKNQNAAAAAATAQKINHDFDRQEAPADSHLSRPLYPDD